MQLSDLNRLFVNVGFGVDEIAAVRVTPTEGQADGAGHCRSP